MKWNFVFLLLFYGIYSNSQSHDSHWMIAQETNTSTIFNFTNNSLQIDTQARNLPMHKEGFCMSDSVGNLIFYTNGIKINNANYQLMQNGDGINPGQIANDFITSGYPIANGSISIPHPTQPNKYYLFHQSLTYSSDTAGIGEHLYYSLVDMNANGGLGRVELKNLTLTSLLDSTVNSQLQTVKHANGRDWWLIQPKAWTNGYYIFLITADTIILQHEQYIGISNISGHSTWLGQAVFSPDGSKYVRYDFKNDLDIFDFDRCTGLLSNSMHLSIQDTLDNLPQGYYTGVAISSSSQFLYVSSFHLLYQYDLWSSNIPASKDTVAVHDGFVGIFVPTTFLTMQLAPDDKIYIRSTEYYYHSIESPNLSGANCNIQQRSITIYNFSKPFFPNFPHYRTPALAGSPCDTLTSVAEITKQETNIKLYPNPANTSITLESEQPMQRVVVYNALGQQVMNIPTKQKQLIELETAGLENGVYFVRIGIDNRFITKQFQILR